MEKQKNDVVAGAIYKHYKGQLYRVIGVAKHSETLEELVMYETLYETPLGRLWVRPLKMWVENVNYEGATVPRFSFQYN